MSCAYELHGVFFTHAGSNRPAVHGLDLCIPEGATTVLLGPNGAGKSTLMDLLLRWRRPDSGAIMLFGQPLGSYGTKDLGKLISLVPQEEKSRFSFTVAEYVLFGRSPHLHALASPGKADLRIAHDAMSRVGIEHLASKPVTTLSGGEHQLLLLARALAQRPRMLLLDEPTSSLDPGNTARVVTILRQLSRDGITLFFTTHDPSVASQCAHQVAMMKDGKLLFRGPAAQALTPGLLTSLYGTPMETLTHGSHVVVIRSI